MRNGQSERIKRGVISLQDEIISVVIPVYNVEAYLDRCLRSVTGQTYGQLEIILVDDGSTDNSPEICDKWMKADDRVTVIHKENGGLSSARNAGIDIARGDYIAFVDSDDYIEPSMYEVLLRSIKNNGSQIACCGRRRVEGDKTIVQHNLPSSMVMTGEDAIRELLICGSVNESACDKLYENRLFDGRRYPLNEINEDIVLAISMLGACESVSHVGLPLYNYCQNEGSITNSELSEDNFIMLNHLDQIESYLRDRFPHLMNAYRCLEARYTQELLYLLLSNADTRHRFSDEYLTVVRRFRSAWRKTKKRCGDMRDVKGTLLFLGLYYPLHQAISFLKGRHTCYEP